MAVKGDAIKIGLVGKIRSGKDTVAGMIEQGFKGEPVTYLKFSSGIHEVIHEFLPEVMQGGKPREALQDIGQLFRKYSPDVWVDRLLGGFDYRYANHNGHVILITDVRQINEAKRLREEGFILIRVDAPLETRIARAKQSHDVFKEEHFDHDTEKQSEQIACDYTVENGGDLDDLKRAVHGVMAAILSEEIALHFEEAALSRKEGNAVGN